VLTVLKSENLNLLEPSGPVMGLLYLFICIYFSCFGSGLNNLFISYNTFALDGVRGSKTLLSDIHIHGLKIDKKYAINCAWGIDAVGVSSGGAC
jgi:hypothetical protein